MFMLLYAARKWCHRRKATKVLKARATRVLRDECHFGLEQPIWAVHGSTRYLWDEDSLSAACQYVIEEQGDADREGQLPTYTTTRRFPI